MPTSLCTLIPRHLAQAPSLSGFILILQDRRRPKWFDRRVAAEDEHIDVNHQALLSSRYRRHTSTLRNLLPVCRIYISRFRSVMPLASLVIWKGPKNQTNVEVDDEVKSQVSMLPERWFRVGG